ATGRPCDRDRRSCRGRSPCRVRRASATAWRPWEDADCSDSSRALLLGPGGDHSDDVTDLLDHAAHGRMVDDLDLVADPPQAQPAHDLSLLLVVADDAAHLLDAELAGLSAL